MAISTDAAIEFFGTEAEIISIAGAAVASGAFSDSGDLTQWTNTDDAPYATATLDATMGGNPTTGSSIDLYARLVDINDANIDANEPSTDFYHYYLGAFPMDDGDTAQQASIVIELPNTESQQKYDFYVYNNGTGQNLNTGSTVDIRPKTIGPHA